MTDEDLSSYQKRLKRAVTRYEEEVVAPIISDMGKSFGIQIGYISCLVFFGILINLKPSLASVIGALGLGSLGISANWERLQETLKKFLRDRRALKLSVSQLKTELDLADDDEKLLKDVEKLIRELYQKAMAGSGQPFP
jgi:hypothetical protein